MKFSLVDILSLIALLVGLLYNFQLITLKNRTPERRFFSFFLANITFIILYFFLLRMGFSKVLKYFVPLLVFSELILPINLWLYLRKISLVPQNGRSFKHYIFPFIASLVLVISVIVLLFIGHSLSATWLMGFILNYTLLLITLGFLVVNAIYLTRSFILVHRHQKLIRNYFSFTKHIDLQWVKIVLYAYLFLLLGLIVSNLSHREWTDYVFYIVLIFFIFFVGHNALKQQHIPLEPMEEDWELKGKKENQPIEQEQTLQQELLFKALKERLLSIMENEQPYLDQELSLIKLSKQLGTNTKYLSHIINSEFNQTFIHFINDYRIKYAADFLKKGKLVITIEALSQQSGFKSKSSFNAAFKRVLSTTPSEFLKNQASTNTSINA